MLKKVEKRTEYFYDIPEETSITGHFPIRGLYVKLELDDNSIIWLDGKNRNIESYSWIKKLNELSS